MQNNPFLEKENPLLKLDFYKTTHPGQYPSGLEFITSYYTPRMTRLKGQNEVIMFGLQVFLKKELVNYFNDYFFSLPIDVVLADYERTIKYTFDSRAVDFDRVRELHELGYLPLHIRAIEEGTLVPIKTSMIEVTNTHPRFGWLVNTIETLMSVSLWNTMIAANLGYNTRQIVNKWYDSTCEDTLARSRAISEFSMRGQDSYQTAWMGSLAWLLSHTGTATVPAIKKAEYYYNANIEEELVGSGLTSTEHSVMCSNFEVDGDEKTMYLRLLKELYPNTNFSVVADSYDYWGVLTDIFPSIKDEILAHNGTMYVRGDSGCPIKIVAGYKVMELPSGAPLDFFAETGGSFFDEDETFVHEGVTYRGLLKHRGVLYALTADERTPVEVNLADLPVEVQGTISVLWNTFGGTVNSKGYKVLNNKIRGMYGDSITTIRMNEIFDRLAVKGFAACNTSLGVGSFSMQSSEDMNGNLYPHTRDTFGVAIKTTHAIVDGKEIFILKEPKTDSGNFKKSQRGLINVYRNDEDEIVFEDELTVEAQDENEKANGSLFKTVFLNGKLDNEQSLNDIRQRLHKGNFK